MNDQSFNVTLIVLSLLLAVWGTLFLLTGRNYSFLRGRGITRGDTERLKRAPAIYFRAVGASTALTGLAVADTFFLAGFRSGLSSAVAVILQVLQALLYLGVIVAGFWLLRIADRYKLFRWNKP